MKEYYGILKTTALFKGIDENKLSEALACAGAYPKTYKKHEVIRSYGGEVTEIGIVVRGALPCCTP